MIKKAKIEKEPIEFRRRPIESLSDLKNTSVLLLAMLERKECTRKELLERSRLSLPKLKGALYYLKRRFIIKIRRIKTDKKPYVRAYYSLNPKKTKLIFYLLKEEGIQFT